jgi:hypothetical protein
MLKLLQGVLETTNFNLQKEKQEREATEETLLKVDFNLLHSKRV